jgi:Uncharacterised nucleotidyltransferase
MIEKDDDKNYAYLAAHLTTGEALKNILDALKGQGVQAIILKGIYLASAVYEELARQPGSDIDLLVKRSDTLRVEESLNQLGWKAPNGVLSSLIENANLAAMNSLMFFNPESLVSVHLHWHIINSTWPLEGYVERIKMEDVWQAAVLADIEGVTVKGLAPEHLVIYLCYHGFTHFFSKPVYIEDIKAAVARFQRDINWEHLYVQADKWGLHWMVEYCLKYIKKPRIGKYPNVYWRYFIHENGVARKVLFLYHTLFPRRGTMAAINGLPVNKISLKHYWRRLMRS